MSKNLVSVCTYNQTFEGDGNKNILKFADQSFENFQIVFDEDGILKDGLYLNEKEIGDRYQGASVFKYNSSDFSSHGFDRLIDRHHFWGSHQNPKYFYAHYRMLLAYYKNPFCDFYWFFDDDVTFEGDLSSLISFYDSVPDDFLVIQAFAKERQAALPFVSVINNKMLGSGGHWLDHCPGPGDNFKNTSVHLGSFFPIVRFSREAFRHLDLLHKEGYFGYSEGFVPTSLASDGFSVSSMLNSEDLYNFGDPCCDLFHKGAPFSWEWL